MSAIGRIDDTKITIGRWGMPAGVIELPATDADMADPVRSAILTDVAAAPDDKLVGRVDVEGEGPYTWSRLRPVPRTPPRRFTYRGVLVRPGLGMLDYVFRYRGGSYRYLSTRREAKEMIDHLIDG